MPYVHLGKKEPPSEKNNKVACPPQQNVSKNAKIHMNKELQAKTRACVCMSCASISRTRNPKKDMNKLAGRRPAKK